MNPIKSTLVFGASTNTERYSYLALKMLVENNIKTHAFSIKKGEIFGVPFQNDIKSFENQDIHTVTLYMNPTNLKPYWDDIAKINPKRVIFNPGTFDSGFESFLNEKNIETLEACTLVLLRTNQF